MPDDRLHHALTLGADVEHPQRVRRQQLLVRLPEQHRHDREDEQRQQRLVVPDVAHTRRQLPAKARAFDPSRSPRASLLRARPESESAAACTCTQPNASTRMKNTPLTPNHGTAINMPASDGPITRLAFIPALLSASALRQVAASDQLRDP